MTNAVYSWVTLDTDNQDIVRVLLKAVEAEEMFGMFFLSEPDFEIKNFTTEELAEIVWEWAKEQGESEDEKKSSLFDLTQDCKSGDSFFKAVQKAFPYQPVLKKSEEWGRKLSAYALEHRCKKDDGTVRNFLRAVDAALYSYNTNYQSARRDGKVDIKTGNIVYPNKPLNL